MIGNISRMQHQVGILKILSDGHFHSGEELGEKLGISRAAVWKHVKSFAKYDLDIHAISGKGYRISRPIDLLSEQQIINSLRPKAKSLLAKLEVVQSIDSTNSHLLRQVGFGISAGHVCLAEQQQAGRGRRGRKWVSPYAQNIYLSIIWRYPTGPDALMGLGLAVGVAVMRALNEIGLVGGGLKWPNDIIWNDAKLAGILLEMIGQSSGSSVVVIGVGLNVKMSRAMGVAIDQPWVSLEAALGKLVSRNQISTLLIQHILVVLHDFQTGGFAPFIDEWHKQDVLQGKAIMLDNSGELCRGVVQGIDSTGALMLESKGQAKRFMSGEVSVHSVSD